jgi:hypothetical protein
MMTMNPDVKRLWTTALDSGEFRQGHCNLAYVDPGGKTRHCCLGVLCALAVRAGVLPAPTTEVNSLGRELLVFDGSTKFLPLPVERWAGLEGSGGNPLVGDRTLAFVNDERRASFYSIANAIREYL